MYGVIPLTVPTAAAPRMRWPSLGRVSCAARHVPTGRDLPDCSCDHGQDAAGDVRE